MLFIKRSLLHCSDKDFNWSLDEILISCVYGIGLTLFATLTFSKSVYIAPVLASLKKTHMCLSEEIRFLSTTISTCLHVPFWQWRVKCGSWGYGCNTRLSPGVSSVKAAFWTQNSSVKPCRDTAISLIRKSWRVQDCISNNNMSQAQIRSKYRNKCEYGE